MRIGTHLDCSWYRSDARLFTVTLDGKRIPPHLLLLADDETGEMVTLKTNPNGSIFQNEEGETISIIEKGKVTICAPVHVEEKVSAE